MRKGDYITALGYWYHTCPKTGIQRRIGYNDNDVVNGKCPPYATCYLCGEPNPAAEDSEILMSRRKNGSGLGRKDVS